MGPHLLLALPLALLFSSEGSPQDTRPSAEDAAKAALAQIDGTIRVSGTQEPVEVIRDLFGVPHIYAKNTADLFFAQGFVVAQDRMWQLEMWRRNGEGRLAEVLGKDYVRRDTFARLLQFRGNWDAEFQKYHPQGRLIFDSFARGVNAAIQKAIAEKKVPIEFERMGFAPEPMWTARTILTRMPGWAMVYNAPSEIARALDIKRFGLDKARELRPTEPERAYTVPEGLNLDDIDAAILDITRDANNYRFPLPSTSGVPIADAASVDDDARELGPSASNNWVVSGTRTATGKPLLANDPHRDVVNPALRYVVHLNAPGWNAIGATEPGVPGIAIGHNDRVAWGFTILGTDQQDIYVEETDPANPNRYMWKGEWRDMTVSRELIFVKGSSSPLEVTLKRTHHGPVLYENAERHRAYAVRWSGAETGGAGYVGALGVVQARNWLEFKINLARAWFVPSHSIVYADVEGNTGFVGVSLTPVRRNWDGLLPVPGKDGKYEWQGYVGFDKLPASLNAPVGFYNTSNNDVIPKFLPDYSVPLGTEYGAPYRYDRVREVLLSKQKATLADMQALQQDALSIPARTLVPLLLKLKFDKPELMRAQSLLADWDYVIGKDSAAAAVYEFFQMKLPSLAYAPHVPEAERAAFRRFDFGRTLSWMTQPDAALGATLRERTASRDQILANAFSEGVAHLISLRGADPSRWVWGDIHLAEMRHPLASTPPLAGDPFVVPPTRRGGDGATVMATGNPSLTNTMQMAGASFSFVADVDDWDRSTFLSAPGNSAQPLSPNYANLLESWAEGRGNPLAFSRKKVEELKAHVLILEPIRPPHAPSGVPPESPHP